MNVDHQYSIALCYEKGGGAYGHYKDICYLFLYVILYSNKTIAGYCFMVFKYLLSKLNKVGVLHARK